MKRILFVCACLALPATLHAQSNGSRGVEELRGTFPFNETINFTQQPAVNGSCGATLSGPVSSAQLTDTGTFTFDGRGGMSIQDAGTSTTVFPPTDASQVIPVSTSCTGTYTMLDEATVDMHYSCTQDKGASHFIVHTTGAVTPSTILLEARNNADGTPNITPYVVGEVTVGCSIAAENTVISRTAGFPPLR